VNTGRYVGKRDLEETVLKTNLEAVQEVVHQLRFRNLGGLIIIDLIDMESAENRDKVYRALQEALRSDKARTEHPEDLRARPGRDDAQAHARELVQQLCEPCSFCEGAVTCFGGDRRVQAPARDPQGPAALRRDADRGVGLPARGRDAAGPGAPRASRRCPNSSAARSKVRTRPGLHQEQFEVEALDQGSR
jgi:ribonuclease G